MLPEKLFGIYPGVSNAWTVQISRLCKRKVSRTPSLKSFRYDDGWLFAIFSHHRTVADVDECGLEEINALVTSDLRSKNRNRSGTHWQMTSSHVDPDGPVLEACAHDNAATWLQSGLALLGYYQRRWYEGGLLLSKI